MERGWLDRRDNDIDEVVLSPVGIVALEVARAASITASGFA